MIDGEMKWMETAVTHMQLKSFIARVTARAARGYKVLGVVLNDGTPIKSVEVKVDDGPWQPAAMDPATKDKYGWKLFTYTLDEASHPATTRIVSRVTDVNGKVQPTAQELETKKSFLEDNSTSAPQGHGGVAAATTAGTVLAAISFSHLINDTIQALLPAIYPLLKLSFALSFAEVGLITLTQQVTSSLLQPLVGHLTDCRPAPDALVAGMTATLCGLLWLSARAHVRDVARRRRLMGIGSAVFHPESSRVARMASGGRHGLAQSVFQVGGNAGSSLGPLLGAFWVVPHGQSSISWCSLIALMGVVRALARRRAVQSRTSTPRRPPRRYGHMSLSAGDARDRAESSGR